MGYRSLDKENFQKSLEYFREVLELNHNDSKVFETHKSSPNNTEIIRGKVSEMLSGYLDEFLGIKTGDIEALRGIGWALFGLEKYHDSIKYFDSVLLIKSTDIGALKGKGFALNALNQYKSAVVCFNNILKVKNNDIDTLRLLGWALIELKDFEEALKCFDILINFDEYDEDIIEGRCISLIGAADKNLRTKKFVNALSLYKDYLKEKPLNLWALIGKIEALWFISEDSINKQDFSVALEKINDALNTSEVLQNIDEVPVEDLNNLEILKIEFTKLKFKTLKELGYQYFKEKELEDSLKSFDDSLKINNDSDISSQRHIVLLELGNQSINSKDFELAIDYYDRILVDDDQNYEALLGKTLAKNGLYQYQEALTNFNLLNIKKPDDNKVIEGKHASLLGLGNISLDKNEYKLALDYFNNALTIKPNDEKSLEGKGITLNSLGKFKESIDTFNILLSLSLKIL